MIVRKPLAKFEILQKFKYNVRACFLSVSQHEEISIDVPICTCYIVRDHITFIIKFKSEQKTRLTRPMLVVRKQKHCEKKKLVEIALSIVLVKSHMNIMQATSRKLNAFIRL